MKLYTLRHKQGNRGISLQLVELLDPTGDAEKDFRLAEAIGQAYCNRRINSLFIRVEPAVVADESILDPSTYDRIVNPPAPRIRPKLKPGEQVPDQDAKEGTEITDERPKFDGNLDNLDLGEDEPEEEAAESESGEGEPTEEVEGSEEEAEDEEMTPKERAKAAKAKAKAAKSNR